MSEDGEHEGLEVILTSLDSLRESIEGKFGRSNEEIDKRTIAERTSAHYGPRVGYRFFVERIDDLKDLIESKSKESLQQNVEHLNAFATQIDAWVENEVRYLFDSSYTSNVVTLSIVLILDGLERFIQRNMVPVDPKEYQRRVTKIRRSIDSLEKSQAIEEERLKKLSEYVDRIIEAKDVADALPETMGTLKSALADVSEIRDRADASNVLSVRSAGSSSWRPTSTTSGRTRGTRSSCGTRTTFSRSATSVTAERRRVMTVGSEIGVDYGQKVGPC